MAAEVVRQVLHLREAVFVAVSVLVALAVVEAFHQAGDGVAQVQGHGVAAGLLDVLHRVFDAHVRGVALRRAGQVDGRFGEQYAGLGPADQVGSLLRGDGDGEGDGVSHAYVFSRQDDDAAGDEHGVFAGVDHAGEPVEGGVGVRGADGLDEGGDGVVVEVAGLVVAGFSLEGVLDGGGLYGARAFGVGRCGMNSQFEGVERDACVPV